MNVLNLRFELANPFDRWDYFKNLGCLHGRLGKQKAWELEHTYYTPLLVDCELRWSKNTDHAGIDFGIGLLGYGINFRIYDTRHWNRDEYTQTNS